MENDSRKAVPGGSREWITELRDRSNSGQARSCISVEFAWDNLINEGFISPAELCILTSDDFEIPFVRQARQSGC